MTPGVLPPNVSIIGEEAFGCTDIEGIILPSADIQIEGDAFKGCDHLTQIIVPFDTSDERMEELAALFAEENPDAQVVRGEPILTITEEDIARFGGFWYLNTVTQEGMEFSAADIDMEFTLQLNDDGTAVIDMGEAEAALWTVDGDSMTLSVEGAEDVVFIETDDLLTASDDDMSMSFGREPAQPGYVPGEPVAAASADDFDGTWLCTRISVYGMNVPVELFADSMQDFFGFDSLDMEIRGANVRMIGDETEIFVFSDGCLLSQDGIQRTLTLLSDGMLACDLTDGTMYFEKISEESTLPEPMPELTSEPMSEPVSEPTSESVPEPMSELTSESTSELTSEATSELKSEPTSEPASEATSELTSESTSEPAPEPTFELTSEPTSEPASEAMPELTPEQTSEPAPEPTSEPTSEPMSEPVSEPTSEPPAEPASVGPMIDVKYTCVKANIGGRDMDPSKLGGEHSVTFHSDGSTAIVLAGAVLDGLAWQVENDAVVVDYYGAGQLHFIPNAQGYELNYANAARLSFTAE